jgi:hypothetical protein
MMTQNIPYKGYLSSKWWLMVIAQFTHEKVTKDTGQLSFCHGSGVASRLNTQI